MREHRGRIRSPSPELVPRFRDNYRYSNRRGYSPTFSEDRRHSRYPDRSEYLRPSAYHYHHHHHHRREFESRRRPRSRTPEYARRVYEVRKEESRSAKKPRLTPKRPSSSHNQPRHPFEDGDADDKSKEIEFSLTSKKTTSSATSAQFSPLSIVEPIVEDVISQAVTAILYDPLKDREEYDSMMAFFAKRIQAVCQLELGEAFKLASAMIKACKEAFPRFDHDLRRQYVEAEENDEIVVINNNPLELFGLRESLHAQLRTRVAKKGPNYRFSEIVDLILCYFSSKK